MSEAIHRQMKDPESKAFIGAKNYTAILEGLAKYEASAIVRHLSRFAGAYIDLLHIEKRESSEREQRIFTASQVVSSRRSASEKSTDNTPPSSFKRPESAKAIEIQDPALAQVVAEFEQSARADDNIKQTPGLNRILLALKKKVAAAN